ncbi:MAG TPA: GumC family protein [Pirellulales bacterium]|jgi:uncharacterized protein involved in exopolysaccharide biosynthesis|nr:GumC family protein [Pirellulales bacterium]
MTQPREAGVTLRDVFRVLFRHKKKGLLFFFVVTAGVTAFTLLSRKTYRSEAKLFVRLGRENVTVDPTATAGQANVAAVPQARETEISSVLEILESRSIIEEVVDHLTPAVVLEKLQSPAGSAPPASDGDTGSLAGWSGKLTEWLEKFNLVDPLSEREQAILQLTKLTQVGVIKKSNLISVSCESHAPETAQSIVDALISACQEQYIKAHRAPGSYEFLSQQAEQLKADLNQAEVRLRDAKTKSGVSSLVDQRTILVQRLGKLEDESLFVAASLSAAEAQIAEMRRGAADVPAELTTAKTTGLPNVAADTMRGQLYTLQVREKELASKYHDEHPELIAIRQEIKEATSILNAQEPQRVQETKGPNHVHEVVQAALLAQEPVVRSLRAKADTLQSQIAEAKATLKSLNENEVLIARMQRDLDLADIKYRKYSDNVEQARLDDALENQRISNLSVVQPPSFDPKPVRPKKLITIALGAFVAFLGAIGLCLFCEFCDHSVKSTEELERHLEIPTLTAIPRMKPRQVALYRGRVNG